MHQSFVSTAAPPTGMTGIVTFHFSEPWYKPHPDGNNPTLSLALHYRKPHRGKCLNIITPHFSGTVGTIKKYLHCTIARLFHHYPRRWGAMDTNDWCIKARAGHSVCYLQACKAITATEKMCTILVRFKSTSLVCERRSRSPDHSMCSKRTLRT